MAKYTRWQYIDKRGLVHNLRATTSIHSTPVTECGSWLDDVSFQFHHAGYVVTCIPCAVRP